MHEMERKFGVIGDDRTVLVMKIDHVLAEVVKFHTLFTNYFPGKVIG